MVRIRVVVQVRVWGGSESDSLSLRRRSFKAAWNLTPMQVYAGRVNFGVQKYIRAVFLDLLRVNILST